MSIWTPSRDLIGYGAQRPDPRWPGGARVAVQCVINYEEGSEYNNADSDGRTELGLAEAPGGRVPRSVPRASTSAATAIAGRSTSG